jgi:hypothetical protein
MQLWYSMDCGWHYPKPSLSMSGAGYSNLKPQHRMQGTGWVIARAAKGGYRGLTHNWVRPGTGGGAKSTLIERRLVVPLLADRIGRREDALVNRARFSN